MITTSKFQELVASQVIREYGMWYNHVRAERDRKRDILEKVLDPLLPEWQVRVNLLDKNIQLENALFLTDELSVEVLTNEWILWEQVMKNANLALKYDDMDMDLVEMREKIVNENGLYWLSATIIDWRDNEEHQPISDTISPLALIIDPKNYTWSKMRFIWVSRRVPIDFITSSSSYDQAKIKKVDLTATDNELTLDETEKNDASNLNIELDNEWMVDIYDHFNVYKGKKYLSTWIDWLSECIRVMEIEPLTESEKLKPTKVKFPIQLHRRKPKYWSVFWQSIADEVLIFQDVISQLTNLQLLNARIQALWPDMFIDSKLWVNTATLSQSKPWWRIIPIDNKSWMPTQNGMFYNVPPSPSQYTDQMIQTLEARAEQTTNVWSQNFGISQSGSQTKAEIQTLQQNANQILIWITNNYLRWQKEYWLAHYRSYALNMADNSKKNISLFQKGKAISLSLQKAEFIKDWKVNITITSKSQQALENDKEFNKLAIIANLYLPNMQSEYAKNEFLRWMWDKSNIRNFDSSKYIRESSDEIDAKENLELLNNNKEVPSPEMNNNADVYLDIYKQAMDTDAKVKAIAEWTAFSKWKDEQAMLQEQEQWVWDAMSWNIAQNNLNQQVNSEPSTAQVEI